ncbi:hypothetical protein [Palaeococcus ferrophilus]|uniref:hypothetical protein n=1 Tax=Palaeococcus ferrophilus TaxID=83868 RepID=UPI0006974F35|nr:hypothetical protein [Palaeococcus ferrophilus]
MDRKAVALIFIGLMVVASFGTLIYGYTRFDSVVHRGNPLAVKAIEVPYANQRYTILLGSFITGDPTVDLNVTLRAVYDEATLIVGDSSFKGCSGDACVWRTRTSAELGATIGALMGRKYYYQAIVEGKDNATAERIAMEEAKARIHTEYLAFMNKAMLGLGRIGNSRHLVVLLIGPREGAKSNRIYTPRQGVLVLEATDEKTLFVEVLVVKTIINSQVGQITEG